MRRSQFTRQRSAGPSRGPSRASSFAGLSLALLLVVLGLAGPHRQGAFRPWIRPRAKKSRCATPHHRKKIHMFP